MSSQPVTLDMSQATPIDAPQGGGVQLDMSKAEPIPAAAPPATISASKEPTTFMGKFGRWAENVSNDLKYGTDETGIGTVLKKMGAHGVYAGAPEAVGDFMASLPLGLLKMGKGAAEATPEVMGGPKGQTWQGLKDLAGGAMQAGTIPGSFIAPELAEGAAEAGGAVGEKVGQAASTVLHPKAAAGDILGEVQKAIGEHPVMADDAKEVAQEILDKVEATGIKTGGLKKSFQKFLAKASDSQTPMTFNEARDFEDTFRNLSSSQKMNMGGSVKPLLREFNNALRQSIEDTADAAGMGDRFRQGMKAYRIAAQYQKGVDAAKSEAGKAILKYAAGGAAIGAGAKIVDAVTGR